MVAIPQAKRFRGKSDGIFRDILLSHQAWRNRVRPSHPPEFAPSPQNVLEEKRLQLTLARQKAEKSIVDLLETLENVEQAPHCEASRGLNMVKVLVELAVLISEYHLQGVQDEPPALRALLGVSDVFTNHLNNKFRQAILKQNPNVQTALFERLDLVVFNLRAATGLCLEHLWRWNDVQLLEQRGMIGDWGATHILLPQTDYAEFLGFMNGEVLSRPEAFFTHLLERANTHATTDFDGLEKSKFTYGMIPLQWLTLLATITRENPEQPMLQALNLRQSLPRFCIQFFRFYPKVANLFSFELFFWPSFSIFRPLEKPLSPAQTQVIQGLVDNLDSAKSQGLGSMACDRVLFVVLSPLFSEFLAQQRRPVNRKETEILSPKQWATLARHLRNLPDPVSSDFLRHCSPGRNEKDISAIKVFLGLDRRQAEMRRRNPDELDLELQD